MEVFADERQIDLDKFNAEQTALIAGTLDLAHIVVGPVIERHRKIYTVGIFVQHRDRIHSARQHYQRIFFHIVLFSYIC